MPRGDGTGPMGMGPMTGRAAGYCAGYPVPGFMNPGVGWFGGGRGRRNWFYATGLPGWMRAAYGYPAYGPVGPVAAPGAFRAPFAPPLTQEQEIEALKAQAEHFQGVLDQINKRLQELESSKKA